MLLKDGRRAACGGQGESSTAVCQCRVQHWVHKLRWRLAVVGMSIVLFVVCSTSGHTTTTTTTTSSSTVTVLTTLAVVTLSRFSE